MDSDDDLNIPPPRKTINLDSDDDDLPPPPKPKPKQVPMPTRNSAAAIALDDDDDDDVKLNVQPKFSADASPGRGAAAKVPAAPRSADEDKLQTPTDSKAKVNPAKVYKEGFLFKQQPSWPYSNQKRYCVIKNCKLFYFENQENMKDGRPQGVIDLNNAKLVDRENEAKLPSSFGLYVRAAPDQEVTGRKERTFIFSVMHAHELGEWKAALQAIVGDTEDEEDQVHWFEKMLQGAY